MKKRTIYSSSFSLPCDVRVRKSTPYRSNWYDRYLSYWSVNRYRNIYISFRFKFQPILDCTSLTGENQLFQSVKKKLEKHTTKKEKSQENIIATAFSLATLSVSSSSTVLVLQPSSRPYFFFFSSVLHVSLVDVLKIWLEGMPSLFPPCFIRWPVLFSMQKLKKYILNVSF